MKDDQWVDAVMATNQKKFIHVNQGNIKGNLKTRRTGRDQELKPVITINLSLSLNLLKPQKIPNINKLKRTALLTAKIELQLQKKLLIKRTKA